MCGSLEGNALTGPLSEVSPMANPKRRHSHSRTAKRSAAKRPFPMQLRPCSRCSTQGRSHTVCENCGHYAGREVIVKDEF